MLNDIIYHLFISLVFALIVATVVATGLIVHKKRKMIRDWLKTFFPEKREKPGNNSEKTDQKVKEEGTSVSLISTATFWKWVIAIYVAIILLEWFWLRQYEFSWSIGGVVIRGNVGFLVFMAQVAYTVASFKVVGATEIGGRLLFNRPLNELKSGLVWIPLWICQLGTVSKTVFEDELPAPPEKIWRPKKSKREEQQLEADVVPPEMEKIGYRPPIRVTFGLPNVEIEVEEEATEERKKQLKRINQFIEKIKKQSVEQVDPYNSRLVAEVFIVIRWRIEKYLQFLTTIGTREEARAQMEDTAIAMVTREFAKITPAVALAHLGLISQSLLSEIRERVGQEQTEEKENFRPWGIAVETAQIKLINFSHELNESVQGMAEAQAEKVTEITRAQGRKARLELEGRGEGEAERARLEGRGTGLQQMASALNLPTNFVIAAELARQFGQNPQKEVIVSGVGGFSDLLGIAAAISRGVSSSPSAPADIPPAAPSPSETRQLPAKEEK
jgi:regulator of protease activity HflC (stomatin/prohibitin superfamily)